MPSLKNKKNILILGVTAILSAVFYLNPGGVLFKASVLDLPAHAPFDGTVAPVSRVPDWVNISIEKQDEPFVNFTSDQLINLPTYDPARLAMPVESLVWGNAAHDVIRNEKITYSTPYMGNYHLDGQEHSGSHLAVDIKMPTGTPLFAIANGVVVTSKIQNSGFGNHIVIRHNDVPSFDDPNVLTTYYSSYSHAGTLLSAVGDVVAKGDQIALSGNTGTSTTPHTHFQIDNENAPWHPYWPFTWQEALDAGLNFYTAVNAGLGADKALETTVHPMKYVQKYANFDGVLVASADSDVPEAEVVVEEIEEEEAEREFFSEEGEIAFGGDESEIVEEEVVVEEEAEEVEDTIPEIPVVEETVEDAVVEVPMLSFVIEVSDKYFVGDKAEYTVKVRDQFGQVYAEGFEGTVSVKAKYGNATALSGIVDFGNFDESGIFRGTLTDMLPGVERLQISYNDQDFQSEWFHIYGADEAPVFSDVASDYEFYDAIMYLVDEGVIAGYPDGTFQPEKAVTRVEALKFILEGIKAALGEGNLPFDDTSDAEWYATYLYTAYEEGIVNGDPDGNFRPGDTVNKAEFYKILFNGMGVDISPEVESAPFADVPKDAWFAPFISYAKTIGITPDTDYLEPAEGMTRGEVSYAIYKVMQMAE